MSAITQYKIVPTVVGEDKRKDRFRSQAPIARFPFKISEA